MIGTRVSAPKPAARVFTANLRSHPSAKPAAVVRAAAAEDAVDNSFVYGEDEAPQTSAPAPEANSTPLPTYHLNVLYLDKAIGIAVDQMLASGERGPVTEYFMWPAKDAWTQLKEELEKMPWITTDERVELLNETTQIINYWQDAEVKHTIDDARTEFDTITFFGA